MLLSCLDQFLMLFRLVKVPWRRSGYGPLDSSSKLDDVFLCFGGALLIYKHETIDIWRMVCPQYTPNTICISAIWFSCFKTVIHLASGSIFDQKIVYHRWCTIFFPSTLLNHWPICTLDWCLLTSKSNGGYINIVRSMLGTYHIQYNNSFMST